MRDQMANHVTEVLDVLGAASVAEEAFEETVPGSGELGEGNS